MFIYIVDVLLKSALKCRIFALRLLDEKCDLKLAFLLMECSEKNFQKRRKSKILKKLGSKLDLSGQKELRLFFSICRI